MNYFSLTQAAFLCYPYEMVNGLDNPTRQARPKSRGARPQRKQFLTERNYRW